jgi:uncharacterized protein (DUF934 family)
MPLLRKGEIVDDPWVVVADGEPLPDDKPALISLDRWKAERDSLAGRNLPIGVKLKSDQSPETIREDLGRFKLVALDFPHFKDGRAYSYARLLRERMGYTGEIRAVGNVLRDQFLFMDRCGIDTLEVKDGAKAVEAWKQSLSEISVYYQPTADGRRTAMQIRHPKGS